MHVARSQLKVARYFYVETQLTDSEIIEREAVRQAQAIRDESLERERRRRMFALNRRGGML